MAEKGSSQLKIPEIVPEGTLRDFLLPIVEFLGILVPGLLFLLLAIPAIGIPLGNILSYIVTGTSIPLDTFGFLVELLKSTNIAIAGIVLVASYVAGHIFFRKDPKIPDEYSFKRVFSRNGESGPVRQCPAEVKYNEAKNLNPPKSYNLEFPYRYLREYLEERGMHHLAELIHWRGLDPNTYSFRTKHFINGLKARFEFVFPYQYTRIQRNEAHVRLMSSLWYATRSLIWICALGFAVGIFFIIAVHVNEVKAWWPMPEANTFIAPLLTGIVAIIVKVQIEEFLHYQRIREIVYILELAFFAKRLYPEMFEGIIGARSRDP